MATGFHLQTTSGQSNTLLPQKHRHHEAGGTYISFGLLFFPDALPKRACGALQEKTSKEEVFGFIATSAGTENDHHQMEVSPREAE